MIVDYLNSEGLIVSDVNPMMEYKIVAKKIITENLVRYFIKRSNGRLLDPKKLGARELKSARTTFIEVTELVFLKYHDYILNKTKVPLNSIERMID
jgi:hypothetical protein